MDLFNQNVDWSKELELLIVNYKDRKHPLEYNNLYELMIMVILSAQDSDANINKIAPALFKKFPNLTSLKNATSHDLIPYITMVKNYSVKANWIIEIVKTLKDDIKIPITMAKLTSLKGIGRKSANVIMREYNVKPEGIMVDLHVLRVVNRLGISHAKTADKIEKDMMKVISNEIWSEVGMAISFLGREICKPTNPKHNECTLRNVCVYCNNKF